MKLHRPVVSNSSDPRTDTYLSSGPPSLRTMFRSEKIVPNMSFASSLALSRAGRARAGPLSVMGVVLMVPEPESGLACAPPDMGLSWAAQSLE
jgi:hypothetical protein